MKGERWHDARKVMGRRATDIDPEKFGASGGAVAARRDGAEDFEPRSKSCGAFWITRNNEESARRISWQRCQNGRCMCGALFTIGHHSKIHDSGSDCDRLGCCCVSRRV